MSNITIANSIKTMKEISSRKVENGVIYLTTVEGVTMYTSLSDWNVNGLKASLKIS